MNEIIHRKRFLTLTTLVTTSIVFGTPAPVYSQNQKPPPLDKELVREFVGKSHSDFSRVKELLSREPGLLNCSCDWGGGDFETGLEAAGHVGNREIAHFLLLNGARMNLLRFKAWEDRNCEVSSYLFSRVESIKRSAWVAANASCKKRR